MTTADADTTLIAHRLAELLSRIAELSAEADSLKAELRALPPDTYEAGGSLSFKVMPNRRFDAQQALTLVPEELRAQCWRMDIDAARVRAFLAPTLAETCMREVGPPRIVFGS